MTLENARVKTRRASSIRQWGWILVSIGAFLGALVVGIQVIGTLMGVLSPPMPPLPHTSTVVSKFVDSFGRERWAYTASSFPDSVLAFYQARGAECEIAPFSPERSRELWAEFEDATTLEVYCRGQQRFDRFAMQWQVLVSSSPGDTRSRLDVVRQIDWFAPSQ